MCSMAVICGPTFILKRERRRREEILSVSVGFFFRGVWDTKEGGERRLLTFFPCVFHPNYTPVSKQGFTNNPDKALKSEIWRYKVDWRL